MNMSTNENEILIPQNKNYTTESEQISISWLQNLIEKYPSQAKELAIEQRNDSYSLSLTKISSFLENFNLKLKKSFNSPTAHFFHKNLQPLQIIKKDLNITLQKYADPRNLSFFTKKSFAIDSRQYPQLLSQILQILTFYEIQPENLLKTAHCQITSHNHLHIYEEAGLGTLDDLMTFLKKYNVCYGDLLKNLKEEMHTQLGFLSNNNIFHSNIRPENIIITEGFKLKIKGFQNSSVMSLNQAQSLKLDFKCPYLLPQVVQAQKNGLEKIDIKPHYIDEYAVDCILKELEKELQNLDPCKSKEDFLTDFKNEIILLEYDKIDDIETKNNLLSELEFNKEFPILIIILRHEVEKIKDKIKKKLYLLRLIEIYEKLGSISAKNMDVLEASKYYSLCSELIINHSEAVEAKKDAILLAGKFDLMNTYDNRAIFYLKYYEEKCDSFANVFNMRECHYYLAMCYIKSKNLEEANKSLLALRKTLDFLGTLKNDHDYFRYYHINGYISISEGYFILGARDLHRALKLLTKRKSDKYFEIYEICMLLGDLYSSKPFLEYPKSVFDKLIRNMITESNDYEFKLGTSTVDFQNFEYQMKFDDFIAISIMYKKDALDALNKIYSEKSQRYAEDLWNFGKFLLKISSKFSKISDHYLNKIFAYYKQILPDNLIFNHPALQSFMRSVFISEAHHCLEAFEEIFESNPRIKQFASDSQAIANCIETLAQSEVILPEIGQLFILIAYEAIKMGTFEKATADNHMALIEKNLDPKTSLFSEEFFIHMYYAIGSYYISTKDYHLAIKVLNQGLEFTKSYKETKRILLGYHILLMSCYSQIKIENKAVLHSEIIIQLGRKIKDIKPHEVRKAYLNVSKSSFELGRIKNAMLVDLEFAKMMNLEFHITTDDEDDDKGESIANFYFFLTFAYMITSAEEEVKHYNIIATSLAKKYNMTTHMKALEVIASNDIDLIIKKESLLLAELNYHSGIAVPGLNFLNMIYFITKSYEKASKSLNSLMEIISKDFKKYFELICNCLEREIFLNELSKAKINVSIQYYYLTYAKKIFKNAEFRIIDIFDSYGMLKLFSVEELAMGYQSILKKVDYTNMPSSLYLLMALYQEIKKKLYNNQPELIEDINIRYPELTDDVIMALGGKSREGINESEICDKLVSLADPLQMIMQIMITDALSPNAKERKSMSTYWTHAIHAFINGQTNKEIPAEYPNLFMKLKLLWVEAYGHFIDRRDQFTKLVNNMIKVHSSEDFRINELVQLCVMLGLYYIRNKDYQRAIESQTFALYAIEKVSRKLKKDILRHLRPNHDSRHLMVRPQIIMAMAHLRKNERTFAFNLLEKATSVQLKLFSDSKLKQTYQEMIPREEEAIGVSISNIFKFHFGENFDNFTSMIDPLMFIKDKRIEYATDLFFEFFAKMRNRINNGNPDEMIAFKEAMNIRFNEQSIIIGCKIAIPDSVTQLLKSDYIPFKPEETKLPKLKISKIEINGMNELPDEYYEGIMDALSKKAANFDKFSRPKTPRSILLDQNLESLINDYNIKLNHKLDQSNHFDQEIKNLHEILSFLHLLNQDYEESHRQLDLANAMGRHKEKDHYEEMAYHLKKALFYHLQNLYHLSAEFLQKSCEIYLSSSNIDLHLNLLLHELMYFQNFQLQENRNKKLAKKYFEARLSLSNSKHDHVMKYKKLSMIFDTFRDSDIKNHLPAISKCIELYEDSEIKSKALDILGLVTYQFDAMQAKLFHLKALEFKSDHKGSLLMSYELISSISELDQEILEYSGLSLLIYEKDEIATAMHNLRLSAGALEGNFVDIAVEKLQAGLKVLLAHHYDIKFLETLLEICSIEIFKQTFTQKSIKSTDETKKFPIKTYAFLFDLFQKFKGKNLEALQRERSVYFGEIIHMDYFELEKCLYTCILQLKLYPSRTQEQRIIEILQKKIELVLNSWQVYLTLRFIAEIYFDKREFETAFHYYDLLETKINQSLGVKDPESKAIREFCDFLRKRMGNNLPILKKESKFIDVSYDKKGNGIDFLNKYINVRLEMEKYFEEAHHWKNKMNDKMLLPIGVYPKIFKEDMKLKVERLQLHTEPNEPTTDVTFFTPMSSSRKKKCF